MQGEADIQCAPKVGCPRVSVIIPVYNQCQFIGQALDSVLGQMRDDVEIIVVDDGSTDEIATALAPYQDRIRYFRQENAGPSSARNLGLEQSAGDFVVFLDSDDLMLPGKIDGHLVCFEADPELDLVNSGVRTFHDVTGEEKVVEPWLRWSELDLEGFLLSHAFFLPTIMFRRSVLEKTGGFDTRLRQAEDVDLLLRMLLAGGRAAWLRASTIAYRQHETSLTRSTGERVASVSHVFTNFFARDDLPNLVASMKNEVCYDVLMWCVWQIYRHGDRSMIPDYLRRTLAYLDDSHSEILHRWLNRVVRFSQEEKSGSSARVLAEFLPWFREAFEMEQPPSGDACAH